MGTPATTRHYYAGGLPLLLSLLAAVCLSRHAKPAGGSTLCIPSEREALLSFKRDLTHPSNRLSSWGRAEEDSHTDCCRWSGVVCHNSTGHVLQLRLGCVPPTESLTYLGLRLCDEKMMLGGKLSPSLLNLKHLTYLDLSFSNFTGVHIPTFLGSLHNLRHLNLSRCGFRGTIPHQLGNLSSLESLDLDSGTFRSGFLQESLEWAAGLSSLRFLRLGGVHLSSDWLEVTSRLPSLQQLHLFDCQLHSHTSLPAAVNFSSLSVLDLSDNWLSSVPGWIFTLPALTSLSLSDNVLQGPIPEGLGNLTALTTLDCSGNFLNSSLPKWLFDDLHKLEDLNLGRNYLQGRIPEEAIGNMTSLASLDLSVNTELEGGGWLFKLLGNLCGLRKIDLSGIKFISGNTSAIEDVKSTTVGCNLHGLMELYLGGAQLWGEFSDLVDHLAQFENLASLDLHNNSLHGHIPESIGRLSSLKWLYLYDNQLAGHIPESIGKLSSLQILDLSDNQLAGHIPESIGALLSLQELNLGYNQLNGTLPRSLGQLINLQMLDISCNPMMTGDVSEIHFANLTKLIGLYALENRFSLKVRPNWVPPFQLRSLGLDSWQIGPQFPLWLRSQTNLSRLQMSRSEITSEIPNWFWTSFSQLPYLNLSQNQIQGNLHQSSIISPHAISIDLSSNKFSGVLPFISADLLLLDLSNNYFSGSISPFLCHNPHEWKHLQYLNLQHNHLSGELLDCWTNWKSLTIVRFGNNEFTGNLPSSLGFLHKLRSLHFENNRLQGEIPTSLGKCKQLVSIDLGENNFVGHIPTFIGKPLALLKLLRLRSNKFDGKISKQICALTSLQVLDLANNKLHGNIPLCFNKFKAMTTAQRNATIPIYVPFQGYLSEEALIVWKGISFEYNKILGLMTSIDISSNNLSGEIPGELMTLVGVRSLNLSYNFLTGKIPKSIGGMQSLESIDFSHNQICGQIPLSMSALTFLCYLDLSNNKLAGPIPSSTQLQSFNASSYAGNKLCGPPITSNCSTMLKVKIEQGQEEDEMDVHMIQSLTIGFIIGFWIIWGPLLFMKSWRVVYFKLVESYVIKFMIS